jgi:hypothetical protein
MPTEQAYIEGFVKRASEYGFNEEESITLLKEATRWRDEMLKHNFGVYPSQNFEHPGFTFENRHFGYNTGHTPRNYLYSLNALAEKMDKDLPRNGINKDWNIGKGTQAYYADSFGQEKFKRDYISGINNVRDNLRAPAAKSYRQQKIEALVAKNKENILRQAADEVQRAAHEAQQAQQAAYSAAKGMKERIHPPARGVSGALFKLKRLLGKK